MRALVLIAPFCLLAACTTHESIPADGGSGSDGSGSDGSACATGTHSCGSEGHRACRDGVWVDAPCAADQRCTDTLGCVACDPSGAFTCVGGHAHRCGADGTVGAFVTTCRAAACVEGAGCANDDPHPAPNPRAECGVPAGELDSRPVCDERAPPDSFEHDVQWAWTAPDGYRYSHVTPLVGNLTDDNDDGFIDLCDTPDILVHAYRLDPETLAPDMDRGRLHVLDGATGQHHYTIEGPFDEITPALGDIDDDGRIEIVAVRDRHLAAFENDGAPKWTSEVPVESYQSSIALGDVDNDGDVEIAIDAQLFDHTGALLWAAEASPTVLADLDDDGDLEVIVGERAFHHDGSVYFGLSLDYGSASPSSSTTARSCTSSADRGTR